MESKFVIFAVFVCLAQYSCGLSSSSAYGLSEEGSAALDEIRNNQNATFFAHYKALNIIFDQIEKLAAESIYELTSTTEDVSAIAEVLDAAKEATDYYLNSTALIASQSESSFDFETVQAVLYPILDDAYALVPKAIFSAQGRNYSEARAEIETFQATVKEYLENLVENLFDTIRISLNTSDANILAVIESTQSRSSAGLAVTANALFNAIKVYGAANSCKNQDMDVLTVIKKFRNEALLGIGTYGESQFSLIQALFIADELNQTKIVECLAVDQQARTLMIYKITDGIEFIWDVIVYALRRLDIGLSDDDGRDFSSDDAVRAEVFARFNAVNRAVLMPLSCSRPIGGSEVTVAEEKLITMMDVLSNAYFDAIQLAQNEERSHSEIKAEIEDLQQTLLPKTKNYAAIVFGVMENDQNWDDDTAAQIANYQATVENAIDSFIYSIFNASTFLADAFYGIGMENDDHSSGIQSNKREALSTAIVFADALSKAHVTILMAANKED